MVVLATLGDAPTTAIAVVAIGLGLLFAARGPRGERRAGGASTGAAPVMLVNVPIARPAPDKPAPVTHAGEPAEPEETVEVEKAKAKAPVQIEPVEVPAEAEQDDAPADSEPLTTAAEAEVASPAEPEDDDVPESEPPFSGEPPESEPPATSPEAELENQPETSSGHEPDGSVEPVPEPPPGAMSFDLIPPHGPARDDQPAGTPPTG